MFCFTDFESLNKKLLAVDNQTSQQAAAQHAFAYKYIIVNIIDNERPSITKKKKKKKTYFGNNCFNDMLTSLTED